MTIQDDVLQAAKAIARRQKHGHMTSEDIYNHLKGKHSKAKIANAINVLDVWRTGIPRKLKNRCLIRELLFEHWKPHIPTAMDQMDELRKQIKELEKTNETLKLINIDLLSQMSESRKLITYIRKRWRDFNNLMIEKR